MTAYLYALGARWAIQAPGSQVSDSGSWEPLVLVSCLVGLCPSCSLGKCAVWILMYCFMPVKSRKVQPITSIKLYMKYIHLKNRFLAHLDRRSMWAIVITLRPLSSSSVVVVSFLKKSSPLKLLGWFQSNFTQLFFRVLATILSFKIFNMSKNMAVVAKNRPWGSNRSFSHITRKRKQLSKCREILGRSTRQDLSAVRFSWRSVNRCRSYCPFQVVFPNFLTLTFNNSKTKAAIKILRHLRSFSTTRSICCANSVQIHETVLELLPF